MPRRRRPSLGAARAADLLAAAHATGVVVGHGGDAHPLPGFEAFAVAASSG
jgi:hypothetical protein